MKKVNESTIKWEPAAHEDPKDPGVLKRVIIRHEEVDPNSKLMMINLCVVPVGRTHQPHSHKTMEEIFYFTDGKGEVRVGEEIEAVGPGDCVIIPATLEHQVKNTGKTELKYVGLGIALD